MKNKILYPFIVLCLICGSFFAGYWIGKTPLDKQENCNSQATKDRLIQGNVITAPPEEIFALREPVVKKVTKDYIVVTPSIKQDPFLEIFPKEVKVLINDQTEITVLSPKDQKQIEKELEENKKTPTHIKSKGTVSDIDPNQNLSFISSENNIKNQRQFLAKEIVINKG